MKPCGTASTRATRTTSPSAATDSARRWVGRSRAEAAGAADLFTAPERERIEAWAALTCESLACAVAALRARHARVLPRFVEKRCDDFRRRAVNEAWAGEHVKDALAFGVIQRPGGR